MQRALLSGDTMVYALPLVGVFRPTSPRCSTYRRAARNTNMTKALIIGISGQDGAYLAQALLKRGYVVEGTSRDHEVSSFRKLDALGIRKDVELTSMVTSDFRSVLTVLQRAGADEIYNLAGQTSVGMSFDYPVETFDSILIGTMNLLECIRLLKKPLKFYNAGSSEVFGNTVSQASESHLYHPRSPYAPPRRRLLTTLLRTTVKPTGSMRAPGSSSTMSPLSGRNASSPARLFRRPCASRAAHRKR
jgi:hypothetical protein